MKILLLVHAIVHITLKIKQIPHWLNVEGRCLLDNNIKQNNSYKLDIRFSIWACKGFHMDSLDCPTTFSIQKDKKPLLYQWL